MKKLLLIGLLPLYTLANDLSLIELNTSSYSERLIELKKLEKALSTLPDSVEKTITKKQDPATDVKSNPVSKIETISKLKKKDDEINKLQLNEKIVSKKRHINGATTCWDEAAKYHNVDPWLLVSIAAVESNFNPSAIGKNKNGTTDIGLMQINDKVWLPKLNKMGITRQMLKDPCVSIYVGAWIVRQNFDRWADKDIKKAIGAYNSLTPVHNERYARKVIKKYKEFEKIYSQQKK